MILAIDTSTRNASVALAEGERLLASAGWYSSVSHSTELMPAVARILESRSVSPVDLEAVAVALGPGGFSALRTGVSAGKGLAMAARIPIIGVGSLELEAYPFRRAGLALCSLLEAGRGEVSSALLSPGPAQGRLREDRITGPDELLDEVCGRDDGAILFCGEGLPPWADAIENRLGSRAVLCYAYPSARAESLAALAWRRLQEGDTDDLAGLQPHYLRMPSIGTAKRRDRRRQASAGKSPRSHHAI